MNKTFDKACELTDFLVQEFNTRDDFRELVLHEDNKTTGIVRNTFIKDVRLKIVPTGKTYGVLCAFELEHQLY
jgi:hypothetical protein